MFRYDEAQLVQALAAETKAARAAFAAASAERLQPLYLWFHEVSGQGEPAALRSALDAVWDLVQGTSAPEDLGRLQDVAESLVPDEEDDNWVEQSAYAQSAAAAVAYAVRTWITDDPQEAVWAARQVYEAADYAAQQELADRGDEDAVLARPVVQEALEGIHADLVGGASRNVRDAARAGGLRLARLVTG